MKILRIADAENVSLGLQDEIRRSEESRYDHRLHGVLLVAQGLNCCQVADLLGNELIDGVRSAPPGVASRRRQRLGGLLSITIARRDRDTSEWSSS